MNNLSNFAMFRFNLWAKPFFHPPTPSQGSPGMENSSFIPNPLSSPALMVLASTAEASRDPSRIPVHPTFPGQNMEKDAPPPFTNSFSMFRPGDPFSPPLYAPVPPFVRPGMDRGMGLLNPGGGSAFRTVSTTVDNPDTYHSAFAPAKRAKVEESAPYNNYEEKNKDSSFLHSTESRSPPIKEERPSSIGSGATFDSISETSENGELAETGQLDEGRSLRSKYLI